MAATAFKILKNNAAGYLKYAFDSVDLSLTLESGQGAYFPSTFPFWVTVFGTDPADGCEIVQVGGRSSDVLSGLTRGQQGTSAGDWSIGAAVQLLITAQHFTDIHDAVNALEEVWDTTQTVQQILTFQPAYSMTVTVGGIQYRIPLELVT